MIVSLYTSRVILQALGVTDYGIYNVVGGVVSIVGLLNASISWATARFLTFDLGKGDREQLVRTFSMCLNIFIVLSFLFLFLAETVGLWFLNTHMTIPIERMEAANWIYQFSVISCVLGLLITPCNSLIFAHEDFSFSAFISILESILKLIVAIVIMYSHFDRLILYAFLIFVIAVIVEILNLLRCKLKYKEATYIKYWNKKQFVQILSYSGWNIFGSLSNMARGSGLNVILNMFFTPAVNAACGIANQVNGVVYGFFQSFMTAVNPQVTKYYAQNDIGYMMELVFRSSKLCSYLVILMSIPLAIEAPTIISLWLGQVPDHVVNFVRLIVVITAIDATAFPINATSTATGDIRLYQMTMGLITILNLPLSYIALTLGGVPEIVFVISLILAVTSFFGRLWAVNKVIDFNIKRYLVEVCMKVVVVACCSIVLPLIMHMYWNEGILSALCNCVISVISTIVVIYYIGLKKTERKSIIGIIIKRNND